MKKRKNFNCHGCGTACWVSSDWEKGQSVDFSCGQCGKVTVIYYNGTEDPELEEFDVVPMDEDML